MESVGAAFFSLIPSATVSAPFLASLVAHTAVLRIAEECGVATCGHLLRMCVLLFPPGHDASISGHNTLPAVVKGTQMGGSSTPLHSAIWTFAWEMIKLHFFIPACVY